MDDRSIEEQSIKLQQAGLYKQVTALEAGIKDQKARSALELMGRKQLSPADLEAGFGEADAAERILQALLDVPDDMQRLSLLPDAFVPAETDEMPADGVGSKPNAEWHLYTLNKGQMPRAAVDCA